MINVDNSSPTDSLNLALFLLQAFDISYFLNIRGNDSGVIIYLFLSTFKQFSLARVAFFFFYQKPAHGDSFFPENC